MIHLGNQAIQPSIGFLVAYTTAISFWLLFMIHAKINILETKIRLMEEKIGVIFIKREVSK